MWDRGIFLEILLFLQALNANSFSPVHLFYIIVQSSCVHLSTNTTTPLDTAIIHTTSINIIIHNSGFWQPENEISCWYLSSPGPQNSIKSFQHYLTQLAEMPDLEAEVCTSKCKFILKHIIGLDNICSIQSSHGDLKLCNSRLCQIPPKHQFLQMRIQCLIVSWNYSTNFVCESYIWRVTKSALDSRCCDATPGYLFTGRIYNKECRT